MRVRVSDTTGSYGIEFVGIVMGDKEGVSRKWRVFSIFSSGLGDMQVQGSEVNEEIRKALDTLCDDVTKGVGKVPDGS